MAGALPPESGRPAAAFAATRLAVAAGSLLLTAPLGFPYEARLAIVLAAAAVPWSAATFILVRRAPDLALNPALAVGDLAVLLAVELAVPETYGAVRFAALFLIAIHAHFQGERAGALVAALGAGVLIAGTAIRGAGPIHGDVQAVDEVSFGLAALATGILSGRLRSAETASRLRARGLTRRTIAAERGVRRRVAESIHDGPVQDLIGLDMVLAAADRAAAHHDDDRLKNLIGEARQLTARNVQVLRDEIVDLGPYAFRELTFDVAIGDCVDVWKRRYGFEVLLAIEPLELSPDMAADLFAITQEAVTNTGRHANADSVSISLRQLDGRVELRVVDDGDGFGDVDPFADPEPGHLGLASIRERAELLDGELDVESSERGTKLVLKAPLGRRRPSRPKN